MRINTHKLSISARSPGINVTRVMPVTAAGGAGFLRGGCEQDHDHVSMVSAKQKMTNPM
jgi:hypothetical protein